MLKEFLKIPFDIEISDLAVKKCDAEKFKSLCNFLQKGIKSHERNIELLAWFIDYRPRPFSNYWRLSNGKTDVLSELSITESGIVEENSIETLYHHKQGQVKKQHTVINHTNNSYNQDCSTENTSDTTYHSELISSNRFVQKEITLEYPSGIKLSVDASNLSLIAQLLKL